MVCTPTGQVAQQCVCVVDAHGHKHIFRRLRLKLHEATRDGATIIHILTNVLMPGVGPTGG